MQRLWRHPGVCGLSLLLGCLLGLSANAQSTNAPRGTAIIFSAPKADVASSNLYEMSAPASPFRDLESSLKKPFESFTPDSSSRPDLRKFKPAPQPEVRKKSAKETANERAEQMYLEPDLYKGETEADLFGLSESSQDPDQRKPRNALERYYDRFDRALTNQVKSPSSDSAEEPTSDTPLRRAGFQPFGDLGLAGKADQVEVSPGISKPTGAAAVFSAPTAEPERLFPRSPIGNNLGVANNARRGNYIPGDSQTKETRLEAYKRFLNSPRGANSASGREVNPYANPSYSPYGTVATARATPLAPTPATATKSATVLTPVPVQPIRTPSYESYLESVTVSAVPKLPTAVPDYRATPVTPTVPQSTAPTPGFKLPKRAF